MGARGRVDKCGKQNKAGSIGAISPVGSPPLCIYKIEDEAMSKIDEPTAIATRLAVVVSTAMNLSALLADETALVACDPAELRSALVSLAEDLRWMRSLAGPSGIHGVSWPADADTRIARLDTGVAAWRQGESLPQEVVASARQALEIFGVIPRP
jgi:hypothetical protein